MAGRKTMTRRVIKPQPDETAGWFDLDPDALTKPSASELDTAPRCPYGVPGDRLWVKEAWAPKPNPDYTWYRADREDPSKKPVHPFGRWRSPIFMPRAISRITMEVTRVRVERVQQILCSSSPFYPDEIEAEGCPLRRGCFHYDDRARSWFRGLWDEINKKRGFSWESNPYVWVVEFRRIEP